MAPTVKEKRRSKSVHLMEPIHFDSTGNPTNSPSEKSDKGSKGRSKTDLSSSGSILRESTDSLSSPSKTKMLRRQSIKRTFLDGKAKVTRKDREGKAKGGGGKKKSKEMWI